MAGALPNRGESDTEAREQGLKLRRKIKQHLKRNTVYKSKLFSEASNNEGDEYVRWQDVDAAWSIAGPSTIPDTLYPTRLSREDVTCIRRNLLRFFSILIYIDAHSVLDSIESYVFDKNRRLIRSDGDLPLFERENVRVLDFGDEDLEREFLRAQYKFNPVTIEESPYPKVFDESCRLPFECRSAVKSVGAFGEVTKITISPNYFKGRQGLVSEHVVVACKKFYRPGAATKADAERELRNLEILKDTITSHEHIRVHLAIILHGTKHLILFPWAKHLDLQIFLLEGHEINQKNEKVPVYDFRREFPDVRKGCFINDVYLQMMNIAKALNWLHHEIDIVGSRGEEVQVAHMDLKPDNILIDSDTGKFPSAVGKWVLTDFGISAIRKNIGPGAKPIQTKDDAALKPTVSIRDVYERVQNPTIQDPTMNTYAHRPPNTYGAPEIEESKHPDARNIMSSGTVGRRSDIWSFGCIFAEVIAFSAGQGDAVKEFREMRTKPKGRGNDYFYTSRAASLLGSQKKFETRPEIISWLNALPQTYPLNAPKDIVERSVEIVRNILVIDSAERPNANKLKEMMRYFRSQPEKPIGTSAISPTSQATGSKDEPAPESPLRGSALGSRIKEQELPSISPFKYNPIDRAAKDEVTNTTNTENIPERPMGQQVTQNGPRLLLNDGSQMTQTDFGRSELHPPIIDRLVGRDLANRTQDRHNTSPARVPTERSESKLPRRNSHSTDGHSTSAHPLHSTRSKRAARGVLFHGDVKRTCQSPTELLMSVASGTSIQATSMCPSGTRVVVVTAKAPRPKYQHWIEHCLVNPATLSKINQNPLRLPEGISWTNVVTCADTVVAWGNDADAQKHVYMLNTRTAPGHDYGHWSETDPDHTWLDLLAGIALSIHGHVVFVCRKKVYYALTATIGTGAQRLVPADEPESFRSAAFSDDGAYLYLYSNCSQIERIRAYKCAEAGADLQLIWEKTQSYVARRLPDANAEIIPYNGSFGCVIRLAETRFCCSTLPDPEKTLPAISDTMISSTAAACMYLDESLLVAVAKDFHFRSTYIQEKTIDSSSEHKLLGKSNKLDQKLKTSASDIAAMKLVVTEDNNPVIVVATHDGLIRLIPITSSTEAGI